MRKPYFKNEHTSIVDVEEFGIIKLDSLPIRVNKDCEIGWVLTIDNGKEELVLCEYGGQGIGFGGRELGVIREIN